MAVKTENATRKHVGRVLDQPLSLIIGIPMSTADAGPDTILIWGRQQLTLNGHLEGGLARLIPHGYASPRVLAMDWEPFIRRAIALGVL